VVNFVLSFTLPQPIVVQLFLPSPSWTKRVARRPVV